MQNQVKYINSNDLDIMISIEGYALEKHSFYCPSIILMYPKRGAIHLEVEGKTMLIEKGSFLLANKNTFGIIWKTFEKTEHSALTYGFALHDQFIKKVKDQLNLKEKDKSSSIPAAFVLSPNPILTGFFDSIANYIEDEQELDKQLVELKTLEALLGILKFHPECELYFTQNLEDRQLELQTLMETNFVYNIPLEQYAKLLGRSLSTFTRDFKAIYNESPHKWILKRRLLKAQELLLNTNRRPIDFYMELGFESLSHFSRSFKKEFGMTMTDFRHKNQRRIDSNT